MKYKLKNGGIMKLQNKGKIPRKQQKMFDRVTQSILNDTRDKNINTTGGFAHRTEEPLKVEHPGAALLLRKMPIGKVLTILGNPVSASTTAGAMAATAADAAGVVASAQGLSNSANKIKSGDYTWRDVPETVLSAMGALPGASVMTRPGSWVTAVNTAKRYGEPIVNNIKPIVVARNIRIKHPELIKQISFNGDHAQSLITVWNNNTGQFVRYNPKFVENARKVNSALLYGKDPTLESAASLSGFKNKTLSRLGINKNIINTIYGTNPASKKLLAAKNLPENVTLYSGAGPKQLKYLGHGQEHEVYIDGDKVIKFKFHRNPESYLPHNSNYSTLTDEFTSTGAYRYKKQGADFIPERKYLGVGIDDGGSLIPVFEEDFIKGVTPTQLELNEALAKNGIKYDGVKQVVFKDGSIAQDVNPKNVKLVDGKPIIIDPITGSAYNPNSRYYKFKPRNIVYGSRPISLAERLGIPKGDRGNLSRFQKEALDDLQYVVDRNNWILQYKDGKFFYAPNGYGENGLRKFLSFPDKTMFGSKDIDGTYVFYDHGNWHISTTDPSGYGTASNDVNKFGNLIITSPKTNAIDDGIKGIFPDTVDKNTMKSFWKANDQFVPPGTYVSGDYGSLPLGHYLKLDWDAMHKIGTIRNNNGATKRVRSGTVNDLLRHLYTKYPFKNGRTGLSTDSYMAVLKQGNRSGHALRFSPDGFSIFNPQGVENKWIYDLHQQMLNGEIPQQQFIDAFNKWVEPYNGMNAVIKNGEVIIPHPFIRYKQGGILKAQGGGTGLAGAYIPALLSKIKFDPEKIVNRVYGDSAVHEKSILGVAVIDKAKEYFKNSDTAVSDRIKQLEEIRQKYNLNSIDDYNKNIEYFNTLPEEEKRLIKQAVMVDDIKQHEDAKRIYFGKEPIYGTMEPSNASPTIGKSSNPYQVNSLLTDSQFENLILPLWSQWKTGATEMYFNRGYPWPGKPIKVPRVEDNGRTALIKNVPYLSNATLSKGRDEKGDYISLYDVWDYNTGYIGKSGDSVGKWTGGKPFEIYQRYYLDDWSDIPDEAKGNPWIAPSVITAKQQSGGILKGQHGILTPWYNLYNSKVGEFVRNSMFGKDYDLSDEEYVQKYGYAKPITGTGMLPGKTSMNVFESIEGPLVKGSFGTGAKYNAGQQIMKTNAISKTVQPKTTSNWDKFLKKSLDEQNKIVKYWDERYSTMRQLQANQKQFKRFVNWINKQ